MTSLYAFIIKEVRHILRDRRTLLILFGMPIAQLILFGYAIRNELNNVPIGIVDASQSIEVNALTNHLAASGYFIVYETVTSELEIWPLFEGGHIKAAVVLPAGYPSTLNRPVSSQIQIISDGSDPNIAQTISAQLSMLVQAYNRNDAMVPLFVTETRLLYNPQMKSVYLFVPGLMAFILMLVSALMTSISVAREKELGTMEVLLISPLRPSEIIIGKVSAYIALACINGLSISWLAIYMFDVPFRGSVMLFTILTLVFIVTALALGVLISTKSKTQQTAMMISMAGLLLPTILLSGFIFPIESMPIALQWLAQAIPARWYLEAARGIMLKGAGLEVVGLPLVVLTSMMVAFIVLAWINLKEHLEL